MRFLPQRFSVQDSQFAPLTADWFGMKSSAMSVFSMAVTVSLTAFLMGTLQGCGSDVFTVDTTCSRSVVDSCISALDNSKALAGDCNEITTFLECFSPCCDYDMAVNPPSVTTIDGINIDVSLGSSAIEYWASKATEHGCGSTVSCSATATVNATTTVTMTATATTTSTIAWGLRGLGLPEQQPCGIIYSNHQQSVLFCSQYVFFMLCVCVLCCSLTMR